MDEGSLPNALAAEDHNLCFKAVGHGGTNCRHSPKVCVFVDGRRCRGGAEGGCCGVDSGMRGASEPGRKEMRGRRSQDKLHGVQ